VAVTPDGSKVYVAKAAGSVSVIDTATNTVVGSPITVGRFPQGVAVTPDGSKVYVTNVQSPNPSVVSVIATATNTVIATIPLGGTSIGVAVTPDGSKAYVANVANAFFNVFVIDTATNAVIGSPIPVGLSPFGVAVTPDGRKVYVANQSSNNVFVIDTASNLVLAVVSVGIGPIAFGAFIQQPAPFAGTPGEPDCHGKSVSALAEQFGGLPAAATARGFSSVPALQDAINVFCRG